MMNLSADVAEMFAGYDGRDRHWEQLELWCAWSLEQKREYYRQPHVIYRRRMQALQRFEARTDEIRKARSEANLRYRRSIGVQPKRVAVCGTWAKYTGGCRCDECRAASAQYQRDRRARKAA